MSTNFSGAGTPVKSTMGLVYGWLFFAILSLMFAGIFALLIVVARTPVIHHILPGTDYARVALVEHVILSFVIWFMAFEGLLWMLTSTLLLGKGQFSRAAGWTGLLLSITGTIVIIITALSGLGAPQFSNYIPVLMHPLFFTGLSILILGIIATLLNSFLTVWGAWKQRTYNGNLPIFTFGMIIAGISFLSAIACIVLSYYFQTVNPSGKPVNIEFIFWGGGHILQFTNTIAMVTVWLFLAHIVFKDFPIKDVYSRLLYAFYLLFIIPAPFIYLIYDVKSYENVRAFTALMEYGLGPSTAVFALAILVTADLRRFRKLPWDRPEFSSLLLSMILFAIGGLISFMIYGYNTKIPSHYHGMIGGVMLAFMGLTNHILRLLNRDIYSKKLATAYPYVYGAGQTLFVLGLFWAGSHGVARKTFGEAQNLDNIVKIIGMVVAGTGGLIAIIGGILFTVNTVLSLIGNEKEAQII